MMDKTGQNPHELPENGFAIYQLKPDPQYHSLRFASLSELRSLNRRDGNHDDAALGVTESRYDLVYSGVLSPALAAYRTPEAILEGLYTRFNLNRPDDFHGHSLSVSDVIALNLNGQTECYYTDSFGFYKLPAFLEHENALKNAEMMIEDDYNMIDGIVNNGPKEGHQAHSREQKAVHSTPVPTIKPKKHEMER
ncbi:MAG: DUF4316 domain-containing protein [Clostridia bacterium]|nr:DUF4316 domain-containing protein [Clostridia bacterium]MBQ8616470.1 DUF4316 domain-containing protein [Clostridia bacterium]